MTKITHPAMRSNKEVVSSNKPGFYVVEDADSIQALDDKLSQFEKSSFVPSVEEEPVQPEPQLQIRQPAMNPNVQQEEQQPQDVPSKHVVALTPELKKKAESLIFFGRLTKDVKIAGHIYQISTLTSREQTEILKALYNVADAADLFTVRSYTLANALKSVDDISIDDADVFEDEDSSTFVNKFQRRVAVVDNMQLAVIEKLYDEFNVLVKESESMVSGNIIKK